MVQMVCTVCNFCKLGGGDTQPLSVVIKLFVLPGGGDLKPSLK